MVSMVTKTKITYDRKSPDVKCPFCEQPILFKVTFDIEMDGITRTVSANPERRYEAVLKSEISRVLAWHTCYGPLKENEDD